MITKLFNRNKGNTAIISNKAKTSSITELGSLFRLPFGNTEVMSHTNDYVYIKNVFGEPKRTFIDALDVINKSIEHGCIVPDKINVICVCKLKIEGRYLELVKIVEAIQKLD